MTREELMKLDEEYLQELLYYHFGIATNLSKEKMVDKYFQLLVIAFREDIK